MAESTCVKCGNNVFEMVEYAPESSVFKLNFVQCNSCGGVVGALDYYNIGTMLQTLADRLEVGDIG